MSDKSISEVKFALQNLLMDKLGLGAQTHMNTIDDTKDKASLAAAVTKITTALDASKKADASKALTTLWTNLRTKL